MHEELSSILMCLICKPSICPSPSYPLIYPSICPCLYPPTYQFTIYQSIYSPTSLPIHPSIYPPTHLLTHLVIYSFIHSQTQPSIFSPCIHASMHPLTYPYISPFSVPGPLYGWGRQVPALSEYHQLGRLLEGVCLHLPPSWLTLTVLFSSQDFGGDIVRGSTKSACCITRA